MRPLEGLNPDFRDLLVALHDEGAEFLVVGAYAVAFHGSPRATGDLDVLVRPTSENAGRVFRALTTFGAPLVRAGVGAEDFARPGTVYQIGVAPRRIDVLTEISGVAFEDAWSTREPASLEGRTVHFIGREALLRNKQAAGRPKDLADLARLTRTH